jgi:prepilin-type processing-associated H-X9-DG protein
MGTTYNQFNFIYSRVRVPPLGPPDCPQNLAVVSTHFPLFLCPSEGRKRFGTPMNSYRYNTGVTFCVSVAWFDSSAELEPWSSNCRREIYGGAGGLFGDQPTGPRNVSDGLSNTAAFSERVLGDLDGGLIREGDFRRTVPQTPDQTTATILSSCTLNLPLTDSHTSDMGLGPGAWTYGHAYRAIYNHLFTPNSPIRDCSTNVSAVDGNNEGAIVTARSHHPSGVNVLMADGGVRSVSNNINLTVWRALGTREAKRSVISSALSTLRLRVATVARPWDIDCFLRSAHALASVATTLTLGRASRTVKASRASSWGIAMHRILAAACLVGTSIGCGSAPEDPRSLHGSFVQIEGTVQDMHTNVFGGHYSGDLGDDRLGFAMVEFQVRSRPPLRPTPKN